jgi:hydroxymethylglutaryl-CoA lyase
VTRDVQIFEVSLRDGLQNEAVVVPTGEKLAHLHRLLRAGVVDVEVTSFVRAARIPALADAEALVAALPQGTSARFWALVPNEVGMDRALAAGLRHVCTFLSASETHNLRNVNRTVRESVQGVSKVIATAVDEGVAVRAYVSTAFGCPYEGAVPVARVVELSLRMLDLGAEVVALGDTTGVGLPNTVEAVLEGLVASGVPLDRVALHAHDTRGTALVNAYVAWQAGVRRFDGSVAGIGGCPYAPGAAGNAATEDLVHLFEGMGVRTGLDLLELAEAGREMARLLGRELPGRVHRALAGEAERAASAASRRSA